MKIETNPESARETVKHMFYEGIKTKVIAAETGVKPGTVKKLNAEKLDGLVE